MILEKLLKYKSISCIGQSLFYGHEDIVLWNYSQVKVYPEFFLLRMNIVHTRV